MEQLFTHTTGREIIAYIVQLLYTNIIYVYLVFWRNRIATIEKMSCKRKIVLCIEVFVVWIIMFSKIKKNCDMV